MWAAGLFFFAFAFLLSVHRGARVATIFSACWGAALGFWLLAPAFLTAHHLRPLSVAQWFRVELSILVVFAGLGMTLGFMAIAPVSVARLARRKEVVNPALIYTCLPALLLPIAYLVTSALVEWRNFGSPLPFARYWAISRLLIFPWILLWALFGLAYSRSVSKRRGFTSRLLTAIVGATLVGAVVLPSRVRTTSPRQVGSQPLVRASSGRGIAPLLVIGLDGGNWRTIDPVVKAGRAPTFARLVNAGIHGRMAAIWPPYWSAPAWGAIVTGHSQDEIGIHEDLTAVAPGLPPFELPLTPEPAFEPVFLAELVILRTGLIEPFPTPRSVLNAPPIWERLSQAGVKTAVVRFPFTYPATGQSDYVISNRVVVDLWDAFGVKPGDSSLLVWPPDLAAKVLPTFQAAESDETAVHRLMGPESWRKPADTTMDLAVVLRRAVDGAERMQGTTTRLIREHRDLSVVMVHIAMLDEVSHAFWQYRFPEDFGKERPEAADIARFGDVLNRCVELLDTQIAELIAAFPAPPNVLIVSDHGEAAGADYPPWKGWHGSPGVFVAAGEQVPYRAGEIDISYYDIAPTILALQGFAQPGDLTGRPPAPLTRLETQPAKDSEASAK